MSEDQHTRQAPEGALTLNGGEPPRDGGAYCGFCGIDLASAAIPVRRFGVPFCSEAHAEAFAGEVRAARAASVTAAENEGAGKSDGAPDHASGNRWDFKRLLKMGACCGLSILAVVFLAGGGGALLGAGVAVLPILAVLACPLGMFFMMRAMHGHAKNNDEREHFTRPDDSREP